jgi:hypothetical protein
MKHKIILWYFVLLSVMVVVSAFGPIMLGHSTAAVNNPTILHIGDSHVAGSYGELVHDTLREVQEVGNVYTYGYGASRVQQWNDGGRSRAGSIFRAPDGQVTRQDGEVSIPSLGKLVSTHSPSIVIISLGTNNLPDIAEKGVNSMLHNGIQSLVAAATQYGAQCYWVGPPYTKMVFQTNEKDTQQAVENFYLYAVKEIKGCTIIDARENTNANTLRDNIHHKDATGWAAQVTSVVLGKIPASSSTTGPPQTDSEEDVETAEGDEVSLPVEDVENLPYKIITGVGKDIDETWKNIERVLQLGKTGKVFVPEKGFVNYFEAYPTEIPLNQRAKPVTVTPVAKGESLPGHLIDELNSYGIQNDVDPSFAFAVLTSESSLKQNAISWTGCAGYMQICPSSADKNVIRYQCSQKRPNLQQCDKDSCRVIGGRYNWCQPCEAGDTCVNDDRFDGVRNIRAGILVLKGKQNAITSAVCREGADRRKCIAAAYNAGERVITIASLKAKKKYASGSPTWEQVREFYTVQTFRDAGYKHSSSTSKLWTDQQLQQKIGNIDSYLNAISRRYETEKAKVS